MTNGIDALNQMRMQNKRATRHIPPPRNPPRTSPVSLAVATPAAEEPETSLRQPEPAPPLTRSHTLPPVAAESEPVAAGLSEEPLTKVSIYVDPSSDEFLESVRSAGRRSRPKIDASRSAVVRFALAQLASAMTPEEIAQTLQQQAGHYGGTGRRRL